MYNFHPVATEEQITDVYEVIGLVLIQVDDCPNTKCEQKNTRPHRLTARTLGSHPRNRSSILRGVTNRYFLALKPIKMTVGSKGS
jgi:hypothetical protein